VARRTDYDEEIDGLYELRLERFTKARNELAKRVRPVDREAAEAIRKLKKPTAPAWAINQLARTHPKDVQALLAAGEVLRRVQERALGDRAAARELRDVGRDERAAVERLVDAARELLPEAAKSSPSLERIRHTLHAAASDQELRDELARGRVTEDRESAGFGVDPGSVSRAGTTGTKAKDPGPTLRKELRSARSKERRAERSAQNAERSLERMQAEAEDVSRRLDAAQRELRRARAAAEQARATTSELEAKLREADSASG
jgi:hypothetical protein